MPVATPDKMLSLIGPRLPADALLPGPGDGAAFEDDAELTAALKLVEAASPHPGDA